MRQPLGWQNITALLGAGILGTFLFVMAFIILSPLLLVSAIYMAILRWKIGRAVKKAAKGMAPYGQPSPGEYTGSYTKKVTVTVYDEDGNEL